MSKIKPPNTDDSSDPSETSLSIDTYNNFNSSLLGLDDINQESQATDAVAAIFDLEGFTNFCKQIEPHLSVPLFLSEFLNWLFDAIKSEITDTTHEKHVELFCPLPFLVKFMGDGVLVLWDVSRANNAGIRNIILSANIICRRYTANFLPTIQDKVVEPPKILRCGLARGTVYSVGNGRDYIGSCINMAARLEKLPGATFAFNRRGININESNTIDFFTKKIVIKKMTIRGIGDNELIGILKSEFDKMKAADKKTYRDT